MPFKCNYCCLQFRLKGTTTRKHNLNLKCMKACRNFASKVTEGNTCFAKKFTEVQYTKRAFKLILVCMCILMCMCVCMTSTVPGWPKCQGWVVDAVPAQGQAHPHQLTPSSLASLAPCWEPQPVSSAASISCLQEGPAVTPFFYFLWRPWCFREADYSRLVAMADCFCCCPSPCWPHQSVWQSTGPLKPLIEFMVASISRSADRSLTHSVT